MVGWHEKINVRCRKGQQIGNAKKIEYFFADGAGISFKIWKADCTRVEELFEVSQCHIIAKRNSGARYV